MFILFSSLSSLFFLSSSIVRVTFVPAVRFLALLCLGSMLFRRFCSRGFFCFFLGWGFMA